MVSLRFKPRTKDCRPLTFTEVPRMSWLETTFCGTLRITDEVADQKGTGIAEQNERNCSNESIKTVSAVLWN